MTMTVLLVHGNYFDVVREENLLVAIQTKMHLNSERRFAIRKKLSMFTFFSICVWDDSADAIVSPRILSKCDDDEDELNELVC